jgi:hypothetical protein
VGERKALNMGGPDNGRRVDYGVVGFMTPKGPVEFADAFDALAAVYDEIRPVEGDRGAYIQALGVMALRLVAMGHIECGMWIADLSGALGELDAGTVWPVLRPTKQHNRTIDPSYEWNSRACIALGVKALMLSGVSLEDAARQAANNVTIQVRHKTRGVRAATWKDAVSWYERFRKVRVKSKSATQRFQLGTLELAKGERPLPARARFYFTLANTIATKGDFTPSS